MKKLISTILCFMICLTVVPLNFVTESFIAEAAVSVVFAGSGTEDDPYQISNASHLFMLAEYINSGNVEGQYELTKDAYYIQTADIDLKGKAWTPIGRWNPEHLPFMGNYNGNYHTIDNLNIDCHVSTDGGYIGLFGIVKGGSISNLNVNGTVVGSIEEGDWLHCGGLVGEMCDGAIIMNCSFIGSVTGNKNCVGGIAGQIVRGGSIESCYFNGDVSTNGNYCGGIVGYTSDHGYLSSMSIANCYAVGSVKADGIIGGVVGNTDASNSSTLYNISSNYYLLSMCEKGINGVVTTGCTKLPEAVLKECADMLGSPFVDNNEEDLNNGYPIFEWQRLPYQFKGGGTADDPYQISSKEELEAMRDLVNSTFFNEQYSNKCYIQTDDIDLENIDWIPIGTFCVNGNNTNMAFKGKYDGNNHSISNLNVSQADNYAGLFGRLGELTDGNICNLAVYGTVNAVSNFVGGICGEVSWGSSIICCSFSGSVHGNNYVGGITGKVYQNGSIVSCYSNVAVSGNSRIGGIIGNIESNSLNVSIDSVYHVGKIEATDENMGSIVGYCQLDNDNQSTVTITNSYVLNGDCKNNVTVNGNATENYTLVRTPSELKVIASDLGKEFVTSSNADLNDGYPIFIWQNKGIIGDVNADGVFNVADITLLQKWLLAVPNTYLENWKAVNFCNDDRLDVLDLCLAKRALIESGNIDG